MTLTNQQLLDFSRDHLCYEINQLCAGVYTLGQQVEIPQNGFHVVLKNTLAESIIIHARCLYEFLYHSESKKHPDDARAFHFFSEANTWEELRPSISDEIKDLWGRAGKEIVHLTYRRCLLNETTKIWKLNTIANEILVTLHTFASKADTDKIHTDAMETIKHWQKLVVYTPTGLGIGAASGATMTTGPFQVVTTT